MCTLAIRVSPSCKQSLACEAHRLWNQVEFHTLYVSCQVQKSGQRLNPNATTFYCATPLSSTYDDVVVVGMKSSVTGMWSVVAELPQMPVDNLRSVRVAHESRTY